MKVLSILIMILCLNTKGMGQSEFEEGISVDLSPSDIQDYISYTQNAKKILDDAINDLVRISYSEKKEFLKNRIKEAVRTSDKKAYQTYMRYALNRGLNLEKVITLEATEKDPNLIQNQIDILQSSIRVAQVFYESDMSFIQKTDKGRIPQAEAGLRIAIEFLKDSRTIFDATAQYEVTRKIFQFLNWDLTQDKDSILFSEEIIDIHTVLEKLPNNLSDQPALNYLKKIRALEEKVIERLIMKIASSSSYFKTVLEKLVRKKTRLAQGVCGSEGSMRERIEECSTLKDSIQENFILVLREKNGLEILKEIKSDRYWVNKINKLSRHDDARKFCLELKKEFSGLNFFWMLPNIEDYQHVYESGTREFFKNRNHSIFWSKSGDGEFVYYKAFDGKSGLSSGHFYKKKHLFHCVSGEFK